MKKTLIITAALGMASVATADVVYNWDGMAGDNNDTPTSDYFAKHAWQNDGGNGSAMSAVQWIPTSSTDHVNIGTNGAAAGNVVIDKNASGYTEFTAGSIKIGSGSSLSLQNGAKVTTGSVSATEELKNDGAGALTLDASTLNVSGTLRASSITLNNGSKLTMTGWGDLYSSNIAVGTGSSLVMDGGDNPMGGLDGATTMDLTGAVNFGDDARFAVKNVGTFWGGNDKVITLTGDLDVSALRDRGEIVLVDLSPGSWAGGLTIKWEDTLNLVNNDLGATLAWVDTEGGNGKLVLKAVPEPTTATLSLLALAGLAARRRRK